MPEGQDILIRPYMERHLIVVSQTKLIKAAEEDIRRLGQVAKPDLGSLISKTTKSLILAAVTLNIKEAVNVGVEYVEALGKLGQQGVSILPISREQAVKLSFPPTHPRDGVVYVGHPSIPEQYYPMAGFHRIMFEQKVTEAVRLLMSLGANSISAEHVRGWSRDFAAHISVPLPLTDAKAGADASAGRKERDSLLFAARLAGSDAPKIPTDLVWYPFEPTWKAIGEGRLRFGLKEFELSVSYLDDFGVNLGVKASIARAGLDLGGKFEDHEATIWKLTGKFGSEQSSGREIKQ
jgi:hypothetical protein